jgi:hypothetical protein
MRLEIAVVRPVAVGLYLAVLGAYGYPIEYFSRIDLLITFKKVREIILPTFLRLNLGDKDVIYD